MSLKVRVMDGPRFFNEIEVRDRVSNLKALLRAIPKWEDVALAEVRAEESVDTSEMSDLQQQWHADYVNDGLYMVDVTKESLYMGLSVDIASVVENIMAMFCHEQKVLPPKKKPDWRDYRSGLEGKLGGTSLDALPGFERATKARILANCFKHNGGKTNSEYVGAYDGAPDQEIRYQNEDWAGIIAGVETFLLKLVALLPAV